MTDEGLGTLLTALDLAAFERHAEAGFRPLARPPAWFARLSRDGSFPFLGHVLEEAQAFWQSGTNGVRVWGPSVEVGEDGREFHYLVKALNVNTRAYLVFQLDEGADRVRDVLQKVRSDALAAPRGNEPS